MVRIIKEVDGIGESLQAMKKLEEMYGITTEQFIHNKSLVIDYEDACIWEFYWDCYCACTGLQEKVGCNNG